MDAIRNVASVLLIGVWNVLDVPCADIGEGLGFEPLRFATFVGNRNSSWRSKPDGAQVHAVRSETCEASGKVGNVKELGEV